MKGGAAARHLRAEKEPMEEYAKCPFFICRSKNAKEHITITCEDIADNMGFDSFLQRRFIRSQDMRDYFEIFCADRYAGCPVYQAVLRKYTDKELKKAHKKQ